MIKENSACSHEVCVMRRCIVNAISVSELDSWRAVDCMNIPRFLALTNGSLLNFTMGGLDMLYQSRINNRVSLTGENEVK